MCVLGKYVIEKVLLKAFDTLTIVCHICLNCLVIVVTVHPCEFCLSPVLYVISVICII